MGRLKEKAIRKQKGIALIAKNPFVMYLNDGVSWLGSFTSHWVDSQSRVGVDDWSTDSQAGWRNVHGVPTFSKVDITGCLHFVFGWAVDIIVSILELSEVQLVASLVTHIHGLAESRLGSESPESGNVEEDGDGFDDNLNNGADE